MNIFNGLSVEESKCVVEQVDFLYRNITFPRSKRDGVSLNESTKGNVGKTTILA